MLRRAVQRGRIAHAFLFLGPEAIGKRLVAQRVAQSLFCQRVPDEELDACGACSACRQVRAGTHPDLLTVACPEGKRELPIKLILGEEESRGREGLLHDLSLHPMSATRRIAIIDDADKMNEESANALLKTLEEPPPGAILFLISPSLETLLPTIRSRCQKLQFAPLTDDELAGLLVELNWEQDRSAADAVAALSEGSLATAKQLLDPSLRKLRDDLLARLSQTQLSSATMADGIISLIDEIASDVPGQRQVASWLLRFAIDFYRLVIEQGLSGAEAGPAWQALLVRAGGDPVAAADLAAAAIDRCVLADLHIQQMMPVPLCLEGWCDDLSRIHRGGAALLA
ncbi:MAG: DNA polymerase III subunit delta' [Planctomycetaceae bacterium]|nr:DNA polymerase III subunit delta' [Planctomycetaceae bacterium]